MQLLCLEVLGSSLTWGSVQATHSCDFTVLTEAAQVPQA